MTIPFMDRLLNIFEVSLRRQIELRQVYPPSSATPFVSFTYGKMLVLR